MFVAAARSAHERDARWRNSQRGGKRAHARFVGRALDGAFAHAKHERVMFERDPRLLAAGLYLRGNDQRYIGFIGYSRIRSCG